MIATYVLGALAVAGATSNVGVVARPSFGINKIVDLAADIVVEVSGESAAVVTTVQEDVPAPWACDIRAWVRAPDLVPGTAHPAEARLAANGSACMDIVGWQVGLRFKERAIVKLKSRTVEAFPTRPRWNSSLFEQDNEDQADWDDIYSTGHLPGRQDPWREREERMLTYQQAIQNRSLWEVHGAEREVFDLKHDLRLSRRTFPIPSVPLLHWVEADQDLVDTPTIDLVESFAVHLPNTNFPPIPSFESVMHSEEEQMVRTEIQLEYYHSVHLANGTTLDIPAGRAAFLPAPQPAKNTQLVKDDSLLSDKPQVVALKSPREQQVVDDDFPAMWRDTRPAAPDCDEGNMAQFQIEVQPLVRPAVQGQNVTLDITLTRTGNGSEHPVSLDIGHITKTNLTWVWNYVQSSEEYEKLVNPPVHGHVIGPDSQALEMLMVQDDAALEKWRERRLEGREQNRMMRRMAMWDHNAPRKGYVRHAFVKDEEKDKYDFQVELPISYFDFPTFETTFRTFRSSLDFRVRTSFLCLRQISSSEDAAEDESSEARAASLAEDDLWTPYSLPLPAEKKRCRTEAAGYRVESHTGTLSLDAAPSSLLSAHGQIRHYLDTEALAPVLTRHTTDTVQYPPLNQVLRQEKEDELRKSRYGAQERSERQWQTQGNSGGGWMHAAKLWQRKERGGSEQDVIAVDVEE